MTLETTLAFFLFAAAPVAVLIILRAGTVSAATSERVSLRTAPVEVATDLILVLAFCLGGGWLLWTGNPHAQLFMTGTALAFPLKAMLVYRHRHGRWPGSVGCGLRHSLAFTGISIFTVLLVMLLLWSASQVVTFR